MPCQHAGRSGRRPRAASGKRSDSTAPARMPSSGQGSRGLALHVQTCDLAQSSPVQESCTWKYRNTGTYLRSRIRISFGTVVWPGLRLAPRFLGARHRLPAWCIASGRKQPWRIIGFTMHANIQSLSAVGAHSPIAVDPMHHVELAQAAHPAVVAPVMPAAALAWLPAQLAGLPARVGQRNARLAIGRTAAALGFAGIATGLVELIGTKIQASLDEDYLAHLADYNHASTVASILMATGVGAAAVGCVLLPSATSAQTAEAEVAVDAEDPAAAAENAAPVAPVAPVASTAPTTPNHGLGYGAV